MCVCVFVFLLWFMNESIWTPPPMLSSLFDLTVFFRCLAKESAMIQTLPSKNIVRFTQNLIRVIEISMGTPDGMAEVPVDSVLPWILLYRLIKQ